jgi:hypothetical protein
MGAQRQKLLILYLASSALDTPVVAWSIYDGTGRTRAMAADSDEPPYKTGLHALQDGWRLIQLSQLIPPYPGEEFTVSYQRYECVFEKLELVSESRDD